MHQTTPLEIGLRFVSNTAFSKAIWGWTQVLRVGWKLISPGRTPEFLSAILPHLWDTECNLQGQILRVPFEAGRVSPACGINEARPWAMMYGFLAVCPTCLKTDRQGCSIECALMGLLILEYLYFICFHFIFNWRIITLQSQGKAMPNNAQTTAQLHSSHTLVK